MKHISATKWVWAFLLAMTALRLAYVGRVELSPDEAYYQMWSERLDWGYYSKGPGVAVAIRLGTALGGLNEFGVRWLSPLLALATSLVLFAFTRRLYGIGPAAWLALLLNVAPIFQAGALLMTIDPLSIAFWATGLWTCWLALETGGLLWWLLTGLAIGLGFLCKYTNAVELLGVVIALAIVPRWRREFRRPGFYLMLAAAVVCGSPPVIWNASHAWITLEHLRERGGLDHRPVSYAFWKFLGAQAGVYSPLLFPGILISIGWGWRIARGPDTPADADSGTKKARFLLAFGLPLLGMYALLALKNPGEPNWTAPGLISLSVLAAGLWHERARTQRWAAIYGVAALIVALPAGVLLLDTDLAREAGIYWRYTKDPSGRLHGWRSTAEAVNALRQEEERALGAPVFLIANRYQLASELNFYLPRDVAPAPDGRPPVFLPQSQSIESQFSFWPSYDEAAVAAPQSGAPADRRPANAEEEFGAIRDSPYIGRSALFITDEKEDHEAPGAIQSGFEQCNLVAEYQVRRQGQLLRRLRIYACFHYKGIDL